MNIDYRLTHTLIGIETYASSCTSKLQRMEQVRATWDETEFGSFQQNTLMVCIETMIEALDAVNDMAEQLLRGPPAYTQSPDDPRQRLIELQVLGAHAHSFAKILQMSVLSPQNAEGMSVRFSTNAC